MQRVSSRLRTAKFTCGTQQKTLVQRMATYTSPARRHMGDSSGPAGRRPPACPGLRAQARRGPAAAAQSSNTILLPCACGSAACCFFAAQDGCSAASAGGPLRGGDAGAAAAAARPPPCPAGASAAAGLSARAAAPRACGPRPPASGLRREGTPGPGMRAGRAGPAGAPAARLRARCPSRLRFLAGAPAPGASPSSLCRLAVRAAAAPSCGRAPPE